MPKIKFVRLVCECGTGYPARIERILDGKPCGANRSVMRWVRRYQENNAEYVSICGGR